MEAISTRLTNGTKLVLRVYELTPSHSITRRVGVYVVGEDGVFAKHISEDRKDFLGFDELRGKWVFYLDQEDLEGGSGIACDEMVLSLRGELFKLDLQIEEEVKDEEG